MFKACQKDLFTAEQDLEDKLVESSLWIYHLASLLECSCLVQYIFNKTKSHKKPK